VKPLAFTIIVNPLFEAPSGPAPCWLPRLSAITTVRRSLVRPTSVMSSLVIVRPVFGPLPGNRYTLGLMPITVGRPGVPAGAAS
jgi:hypothetical protein